MGVSALLALLVNLGKLNRTRCPAVDYGMRFYWYLYVASRSSVGNAGTGAMTCSRWWSGSKGHITRRPARPEQAHPIEFEAVRRLLMPHEYFNPVSQLKWGSPLA